MKYIKYFEELRIWKPEIGDIIIDQDGDKGTIITVSDKGVASVDYGDGIPLSTYTVGLQVVSRDDGKNVWQLNEAQMRDVTYEEALESSRLQKFIIAYIETHYPDRGYANNYQKTLGVPSLLGAYGKSLTSGKVKKIQAFAKRQKDAELAELTNRYAAYMDELQKDLPDYNDEIDTDI